MKTENMKRISIYPHARALSVVGTGANALNRAVEIFAFELSNAIIENSKIFTRHEWCLFVDSLNGTVFDSLSRSADILRLQIEDSIKLDGLNKKWFEKPSDTDEFVKKLSNLSNLRAWGVILTVEFFWENHEFIDVYHDNWFELGFRPNLQNQQRN